MCTCCDRWASTTSSNYCVARWRIPERGLGQRHIDIDDEALVALAHGGDGDARRALGMLEVAADLATPVENGKALAD